MSEKVKKAVKCLQEWNISSDSTLAKEAIVKILNLGEEGCDITQSLPFAVKMLPSNDVVLKKLACLLLTKYGSKVPEVMLLANNTLALESRDPNPLIRSLALKTGISLDNPDITVKGLNDESPIVRRSAILNHTKLNKTEMKETEIVDILYEMMRDEDPLVVSNSLLVLDEILEPEGGVAINRNITHYLLSRMNAFSGWSKASILRILTRYKPKTEQEMFDILNVLDCLLDDKCCSVIIETYNLFKVYLGKENATLLCKCFSRVCSSLKKILIFNDKSEMSSLVVDFLIQEAEPNNFPALREILSCLLCKIGEDSNLTVKKFEALSLIVNDDSFESIFECIAVYLTHFDSQLSSRAIRTLGNIAQKMQIKEFHRITEKLLKVLYLGRPQLVTEVLNVIQQLDLSALQDKTQLVQAFQSLSYEDLQNDETKLSYLWLLGEYADIFPLSPYILLDLVDVLSLESDCTQSLGSVLLVSAFKVYFKRPAESQLCLGKVLEFLYSSEVKNEVVFYYNLMKNNLLLCQQLILTPNTSSIK